MRVASKPLTAWLAIVFWAFAGTSTAQVQAETDHAPVVFVCKHGNVKSLIASSLFNKAARERGLPFRSVSRGVTPEASVPPKIAEALRNYGVEVAGYKPKRLSALDVSGAERTIAIGVGLTNFSAGKPVEVWSDIPPASVDFSASRTALLRHIDVLLDELTMAQRP